MTDEFVTETEAGLEPTLLEPKYGTIRAGEKDAFDGSECNH
jgi:hypothetical protein